MPGPTEVHFMPGPTEVHFMPGWGIIFESGTLAVQTPPPEWPFAVQFPSVFTSCE
jgi:hypothetical protein